MAGAGGGGDDDGLDFYEVCSDSVASFEDTHSGFSLPSDFVARLGFTVDIFDGAVLIDSLNRTMLPVRDFPFVAGDEVVSVDGVNVENLIQQFIKYAPQGNIRAARRLAAARIRGDVHDPVGENRYAARGWTRTGVEGG